MFSNFEGMFQGQKLTASASSTSWTTQKSMYSLQVTDKGLFAYVKSNPPQAYFSNLDSSTDTNKTRSYVVFSLGDLSFYNFSLNFHLTQPTAVSAKYTKLMPDGHLKKFEWQSKNWVVVEDLLSDFVGECGYPLVCGRNVICSSNQQCICPKSSSPRKDYFRAVNDRQPNLGCSEITPLTCNSTRNQDFIELKNVK